MPINKTTPSFFIKQTACFNLISDYNNQNTMGRLHRLKIFSFAKFQAFLMGLIGMVCGFLYSFGGLIIDVLVSIGWVSSSETPGLSYGTILAFGALVGMPIIFVAIGFFSGIIEAILYNIFATWFGGLAVNFKKKE